jgi:deoxycytidylate deaminase
MSEKERPTWDQTWMKMARQIAKRSLCDRDQVGAVIASETNRVVASGYNGPPAKFDHQGKTCLAWCPRSRDMRGINGYEYRYDATQTHQLTEWSHDYDGNMVLVIDDIMTYRIGPENQKDLGPLMESCGWVPILNPTDDKTTSDQTCPSLHAEANALSVCDREQREGGTIYITSYPCYDCAKLIANSGLHRVVYRMTKRGSERRERATTDSIDFLRECYLEVIEV